MRLGARRVERHRVLERGLGLRVFELERERAPLGDLRVVRASRLLDLGERVGRAAPQEVRLRGARVTRGRASRLRADDATLDDRLRKIALRDERSRELPVELRRAVRLVTCEGRRASPELGRGFGVFARATQRASERERRVHVVRVRAHRGASAVERGLLRERGRAHQREREGHGAAEHGRSI